MTRVVIDTAKCIRFVQLLSLGETPRDEEDTSLPTVAREMRANFFFFIVAICHQTSPRTGAALAGTVRGRFLKGWDYLIAKFEAWATENSSILLPSTWKGLAENELRAAFKDDELGELLSDPGGRTAIVNDLGVKMAERGWSNVSQMLEANEYRVSGLLTELSSFFAYRDPVRKKSLFFLSLLKNSGLVLLRDQAELGPPVDYHEVRGHLRTGLISIQDPELLLRVASNQSVSPEDDVAIRSAVYGAIMLVSREAGLTPSQLHYLYWNLFRSVCRRDSPSCANTPLDLLPKRYKYLLSLDSVDCCPFFNNCPSAGHQRPIVEHVFETDFY